MSPKEEFENNFEVIESEEIFNNPPISEKNTSSKIIKDSHSSNLIAHLNALSKYLSDGNVKWYRKSIVIGILAYNIKPDNSLPNWNEFFNFLEDIGTIEWAVRFLGKELNKYY